MAAEAMVGLCAPGGLHCRELFSSGQVGVLATPCSNSQEFQLGLCSVLAIEMAWVWDKLPPSPDCAAYLLCALEQLPVSEAQFPFPMGVGAPIIEVLDPLCKFNACKVLESQSSTLEL